MTHNQIVLIGWKEICEVCGIRTRKTMKKMVKKYKIPVKQMNGRPMISKEVLSDFFRNFAKRSD